MKLKEVQNQEVKDVVVTVRTTKKNSEWMKKNNISPSLLFDKAIEELQKNNKNLKKGKVKKRRKR